MKFSVIVLVFLCLYGMGCTLSQSLMSLCGSFFAVASLVCAFSSYQKLRKAEKVALILSLTWLAFSILNLCFRPWDAQSSLAVKNLPLILVPVFALVYLRRLDLSALQWPLYLISACVLITSIHTLYFALFYGSIGLGFFHNPIYFAYNLLPAFVFFCEIFLRRTEIGRYRYSYAAGTAFCLFLEILSTGTRAVLATALLYLILRLIPSLYRRVGVKVALLSFLLAFGSLGVAYKKFPYVGARLALIGKAHDTSLEARLIIWRHNWSLFRQSPFIGTGASKNAVTQAELPGQPQGVVADYAIYAHSIYLQSLADSGIIGFFLFFGFWIAFGIACPVSVPILLVVAIGGLTENIFNNSKAMHAVLFYALITGLLSAHFRKAVAPPGLLR